MTGQLALPLETTSAKVWNQLPWYGARAKARPHHCGECGRPSVDYYRKLSSTMALALVQLYKLMKESEAGASFHVNRFDPYHRGESGVLSAWGLVEEVGNRDRKKKTSGHWRLTPFGTLFVEKRAEVPQYVILGARSALKGYAGPLVDIRACLEYKNRFNYPELMKLPIERMI